MKAILVDIKDISDSREVYQSKPHPFLWIFTYILLALLGSAMLWASIGKIEIVVKANGQVRPAAGISTVRNLYGGIVKEVKYEQGALVKKGDLLYTIEHDALTIEKENLERQLGELNLELNNLLRYRESIILEQNTFNEETEPMYYQRVSKLLLEIESARIDANYKVVKIEEENKVNKAQLSRYIDEKNSIERYIESLDTNKNQVGDETDTDIEYRRKFENYLIACREINRKYDEQKNQIKASNYESLKLTLNEERRLKEAYSTLLECITQDKILFVPDDEFAYLYNDYLTKLRDLENQYLEAKSIYEAFKSMEFFGATKYEIENAKIQMDKAEGAFLNFKTGYKADIQKIIKDKEKNILELESRINGSLDKETLLNLNEEDRENSLKKLYLDERQNMLDYKDSLIDRINTLNLSIRLGETELNSLKANKKSSDEQDDLLYINRLKVQEIVATDERIKSIEENIKSLEQSIKKIEIDIDNAIVTASIDGAVNVLYEMLPGDFISSGQEVLTIIPDNNTAYTMQIYVSNEDIGELKVNDTVKYNFAALPSKEYGELRGQIISISKDALINETNGQSFYIVKASVPSTKLIGANGKQGEIKVGMLCEANIITKEKTFLRYFLEKIDLLD
ncbi:MAG TPA: HlyD family efflux transporter periplasmic adaptor subunit [Clostridiaceae bacterium]|nr:HlyD family efflux transporter periplasmic adaptor subunit [Clostridiaceae bacterium]